MQIQEAEEYNETLLATKENLETAEYIEGENKGEITGDEFMEMIKEVL